MGENKKTEFHIEDRYMRRLVKNIYFNILIILVFFGVFNLLFKDHQRYDSLIRYLLIAIFIIAGIGIILSNVWTIRRYQTICYKIKADRLEYFDGKREHSYLWASFQNVVWDKNKISLMYPCLFHTTDGKFYLHRRIGDQETLLPEILDHIKTYAKIDPEIPPVFRPRNMYSIDGN